MRKDSNAKECQELLDRHNEEMLTVIHAASKAVEKAPESETANAFLNAALEYYEVSV